MIFYYNTKLAQLSNELSLESYKNQRRTELWENSFPDKKFHIFFSVFVK